MSYDFLALVPPLLVIITAFITKKVVPSLLLGIVSAAYIAKARSIQASLLLILQRFIDQADATNLYTFGFLFALGLIIAMMNQTGATQAYSTLISKKINSAKMAQSASIVLSLCFMIDDFFSSITVGCIMRPLTDRFVIARAKLAYLIDSLAAPMVIIVPVSSWIAMIIAQLENGGISTHAQALIHADAFTVYLTIIPYIFYSFINLLSAIFVVGTSIQYGPMATHEHIARSRGNLFGGKEPLKSSSAPVGEAKSSLFDFILPIGCLLSSVIVSMLYMGGYYLFGGTHSFVIALSQPDIIFSSLFFGGVITLIITSVWYALTGKITAAHIPTLTQETKDLMLGSITVLLLAWTFSKLLIMDLKTGDYLAHLVIGHCSTLWLPALFYALATITSISIGSSWGTIAVLTPLAIPMIATLAGCPTPLTIHQVPLLLPLLGAIFAGAVTGDHVSPIAGTTIMSATSAGSYHADHVQTQLWYAIPGIIGTLISFIVVGIFSCQLHGWPLIGLGLVSGVIAMILLHCLNNAVFKKNTF